MLDKLTEHEARLVDAHVYKAKINGETFGRESKRLAREMNEVRLQLRQAPTDSIDIDGVLGFAKSIIRDPERMWSKARPQDRLRLQKAIYPNGLTFDGELFGIGDPSFIFKYLQDFTAPTEHVVSPTGFEPVSPA
jgi:hypothetical protein